MLRWPLLGCRYPELVPAARLMQSRLKKLLPDNSSYFGMPLTESLIPDNNGSLCMQETNTLYQARTTVVLSDVPNEPEWTSLCPHAY